MVNIINHKFTSTAELAKNFLKCGAHDDKKHCLAQFAVRNPTESNLLTEIYMNGHTLEWTAVHYQISLRYFYKLHRQMLDDVFPYIPIKFKNM